MRALSSRYYAWFFAALAVLVLAQLAWWGWNFIDQVAVVADLRASVLFLRSQLDGVEAPVEALRRIDSEAVRRRVMFLSESGFFALLTLWALYLLYRALRREDQTRALQKSFIEIISHESKTPLTALKLRLESLQDPTIDENERRMEIDGGLEEVRRLITTFEKMLTLNRSERQAFILQPVNLVETIDAVLRRLEPLFRRHEVEVSVRGNEDALVAGDRAGLETSIQCLVENSVLHNPNSGRRIWIDVVAKERTWVLRVRDNGPGVGAEEQQIIFDKFTRGSRSKGAVPGTGLGLYIARKIAEAHHGALRIEESSASGSTFLLEIPAVST